MSIDLTAKEAARQEILNKVAEYYENFLKADTESFTEGDRISYAGRVLMRRK